MAAVTGTLIGPSIPGLKFYKVTADDGDTFTPSNVSVADAVAFYDQDPGTGNPVGCTVSSNVITIQCTGASGVDFIVQVFEA